MCSCDGNWDSYLVRKMQHRINTTTPRKDKKQHTKLQYKAQGETHKQCTAKVHSVD